MYEILDVVKLVTMYVDDILDVLFVVECVVEAIVDVGRSKVWKKNIEKLKI
jgi:hypothetical protein